MCPRLEPLDLFHKRSLVPEALPKVTEVEVTSPPLSTVATLSQSFAAGRTPGTGCLAVLGTWSWSCGLWPDRNTGVKPGSVRAEIADQARV